MHDVKYPFTQVSGETTTTTVNNNNNNNKSPLIIRVIQLKLERVKNAEDAGKKR